MKINEKIYTLRKEHNLSQEELADRIGVSRQTVSKWELGESCPDFDKIVPLCEVFGISSDELLSDKKITKEVNNDKKTDVVKALLICGAIFLYFIAIVSIIFTEEFLNLNDGVCVSIFLTLCALATVMIVFACMTRPGEKVQKEETEKKKDPVLEGIISIITLMTTAAYLLISFLTMAWHLTWIIWVIYSLIIKIINLAFSLRGDNNEE